jgi:serine/threonine protein phosphatase PrpC
MPRFLTRILSEKGHREINEDTCLAQRIGNETYFLAVADGMGGKEGGEIASKLAISSVSEYIADSLSTGLLEADLKTIIKNAFLNAQTAIADYVNSSPDLKGMGTTLTILLLHDKKYTWGSIGDSRIYHLNGNEIKLMTEDHSYISDYFKSSRQDLPQRVLAQYGNIVTRIVDGGTDIPDIFPVKESFKLLKEGDFFLLCSDGLIIDKTINLDHVFKEILSKNSSLRRIAKNLVRWALENGSDDNISVVLGKFGSFKEKQPDEADYKTVRIVLNNMSIWNE